MSAKEEIEDFKRRLLADRLGQCTEKQQAFFHKVYPNGVSAGRLENAIDLCERTIRKNETALAEGNPRP